MRDDKLDSVSLGKIPIAGSLLLKCKILEYPSNDSKNPRIFRCAHGRRMNPKWSVWDQATCQRSDGFDLIGWVSGNGREIQVAIDWEVDLRRGTTVRLEWPAVDELWSTVV